MKVKDLERMLATQTPFGATEIDQRSRRLREVGLLPVGGRGRHAPDIHAEHAAALLLSLAATASASGTKAAVERYLNLPASPREAFEGFESVFDALVAILSEHEVASMVDQITVCRTWPEIRIAYTETGAEKREATYRAPEAKFYPAREEIVLNGSLLAQIGAALAVETASGWGKR